MPQIVNAENELHTRIDNVSNFATLVAIVALLHTTATFALENLSLVMCCEM